MYEYTNFYINGQWVAPEQPKTLEVINPATEQPMGIISLGSAADVNKAVAAAKNAFESFSQTTRDERIALLEAIIGQFQNRLGDLANAISAEMGAPVGLANAAQAPSGLAHFAQALEALKHYAFETIPESSRSRHRGRKRHRKKLCL